MSDSRDTTSRKYTSHHRKNSRTKQRSPKHEGVERTGGSVSGCSGGGGASVLDAILAERCVSGLGGRRTAQADGPGGLEEAEPETEGGDWDRKSALAMVVDPAQRHDKPSTRGSGAAGLRSLSGTRKASGRCDPAMPRRGAARHWARRRGWLATAGRRQSLPDAPGAGWV